MAKEFNIRKWQSKQRLAEQKTPTGGDEKLRSTVEAIADKYSYGEILDAIESFYIKNDEQVYAEMARKHAKEFRNFLDSEDELDEQSVTGAGASFSAGAGEGYATPNAFANDDDWKNKNTKYE